MNKTAKEDDLKHSQSGGVDEGLVAMYLGLSPEQRLRANDMAVRAILELRDGFKQTKDTPPGPGRPA